MRAFDSWTAFLLMLFAIVGLCGLFASYATSIPLERGAARSLVLDQAAGADPAGRERLRPVLGTLAPLVLDEAGPLPDRIARARQIVVEEQLREAASIGFRTRLMLGVVTLIAAALGAGILALCRRPVSAMDH